MSSLPLPGLQAEVELWRDAWGIPHIRAAKAHDAFLALGFTHATDRMWQMDVLRRRACGRYAEWLGPSVVPADLLARRMDMAGCSQRDFAALDADARAMLQAYTLGVNAYIDNLADAQLPQEYVLLGEKPEPWQAWHCIAVFRQTSLLLNSVYPKLWRALALPVVGEEVLSSLRMDCGESELVCLPPGAACTPAAPDLEQLRAAIAGLLHSAPHDTGGGGSNNWAVHGSRSASGQPLLAGDPHRLLDIPNMYLQCHVACDEFDIVGLTSPGVPGFPHFAHNAQVAWCVTVAFVDTADVYLERFAEAGARYLHEANDDGSAAVWQNTVREQQTIWVRGAQPVICDIVRTSRGPVVAGDVQTGSALVLRHAPDVELDTSFNCLLPMMRAGTVNDLYAACKGWGLIDHNLVAADTQGHIGHLVRAKVPRRTAANGWLPVPGWLPRHAWNGWIAWEDMPRQINPAAGVIVTANNRVRAEQGDYLCTDCHPSNRAFRIWEQLAALPQASADDMATIHRDTLSLPAQELCARLQRLEVSQLSEAASGLRAKLLSWDCRMHSSSVEASAYVALRTWLVRQLAAISGLAAITAQSQPSTVPPGISALYQLNWCLPGLLRHNDERLLAGTTWDALLQQGLEAVATAPEAPWGDQHQLVLRHPLAGLFPHEPQFAPRNKGAVGGDNDTVFTTGFALQLGTQPTYASLARYVFTVGDWSDCRWVVFHGASGDAASPHFDDQSELWRQGEMLPMLYHWEQIEAQAQSLLLLQPR